MEGIHRRRASNAIGYIGGTRYFSLKKKVFSFFSFFRCLSLFSLSMHPEICKKLHRTACIYFCNCLEILWDMLLQFVKEVKAMKTRAKFRSKLLYVRRQP